MQFFKKGQLIKSKAGRDKDKVFIIIDIEDEYVYLVDGNLRRIENPKKKKRKHVQPTNYIVKNIKQKIDDDEKIKNEDIRKELADYLDNKELIKEEQNV